MFDATLIAGLPLWFDHEVVDEIARAAITSVALSADPVQRHFFTTAGLDPLPHDLPVGSIVDALRNTEGTPHERAPETSSEGRLIAVWGPKGSPGRTTVAIELATLLTRTYSETILVDADTYGGDVVQLLGLVDDLPTLVWAARTAGGGELLDLRSSLARSAANGPVVLPGILRNDLAADIGEAGWARLLERLRNTFAMTVCDVGGCLEPSMVPFVEAGPGRNHVARRAVAAADHVVAVVRADPIGVKNFLWALTVHEDILDKERLVVVVNQVRRSDGRDIVRLLQRRCGLRPAALLPWAPRDLEAAVEEGRAVSDMLPASAFARAAAPLAERLGARIPPRGLLARLGGRS